MKTIKKAIAVLTLGTVLGGVTVAEATLTDLTYSSGNGDWSSPAIYNGGDPSMSQVIPDNTPAGVGYSINFVQGGPNLNTTISDITLTLDVTGGYNGDLYGYLTHGSQTVVLFNQDIGAATSSGLSSVTFGVSGSTIQGSSGTAGTALTGSYSGLSGFVNTSATGSWTLFLADLSAGDTSTLVSWNLNMSVVPEPITYALGIFAGLLGLSVVGSRLRKIRA